MRSMMEGHQQLFPSPRRSEHLHVPLHHPCGLVPLPGSGRNARNPVHWINTGLMDHGSASWPKPRSRLT